MLEPAQASVGAWNVRGSGVSWESLIDGSLTGFVLVGREGESLVLFGVPSPTSAHSAGVEDKRSLMPVGSRVKVNTGSKTATKY